MYVLYKKKNILLKSSYAELGIKLIGHLMVSSSSTQNRLYLSRYKVNIGR